MSKTLPTLFLMKCIGVLLVAWYFLNAAMHPFEFHLIDTVNLIMHEAGHTLFMILGQFLFVAGGSLFQIIVPAFCVFYFYMRDELLSACVMLMWVGESCMGVAVYAGDAVLRQLPLLGDDPESHDWRYLLETTGLLDYTAQISGFLHGCALGIIAVGIGFSCYLLYMEYLRLQTTASEITIQ